MLIKKIAFRFISTEPWTEIPFQNGSAKMVESNSISPAGTLFALNVNAYVAHISDEKDAHYAKLATGGGLFLLLTQEGHNYRIGSLELRASFTYERMDGGGAGSKSGYNISINYKGPKAATFKIHNPDEPVIIDPPGGGASS